MEKSDRTLKVRDRVLPQYDPRDALRAMIDAVANKMAPITTGIRLMSPDRRTRKKVLRRKQKANYYRHLQELNPPGSKMRNRSSKLSPRACDGTMR